MAVSVNAKAGGSAFPHETRKVSYLEARGFAGATSDTLVITHGGPANKGPDAFKVMIRSNADNRVVTWYESARDNSAGTITLKCQSASGNIDNLQVDVMLDFFNHGSGGTGIS